MSPTTTEATANGAPGDLARVATALERAAESVVGGDGIPAVAFEAPRNADFGDFASNLALQLAKRARRAPQQLAGELVERMFAEEPELHALVATATPVAGFINLRMAPAYWQRATADVLRAGADYGRAAPSGRRISLEFGSANPTGPLLVVQGRTLSLGDSLARTLRFLGAEVTTEWYVNDAGSQIDLLARSLYARYRQLGDPAFPFPVDGYPGDYLVPVARTIRDADGDVWDNVDVAEWLPHFARIGRDAIVDEQRAGAERFGVRYEHWQSEKSLHDAGSIDAAVAALRERGLIFERDGATWMQTTAFGDDKDRVVIRSDGRPTYYAPDIAYHYEKLSRADEAILILGPDHHGYIGRLATIAAAYGRPNAIRVLIAQQMTLQRDGHVVSLSKREGNLLELDEIVAEVGVDAARFFFVNVNAETPLTFDLSLAVEQSSENPVYYVQYGHARIASLERKAPARVLERALRGEALERLGEPAELTLARRLAEFPAVVRAAADALAPTRIARYARDVAADFHQFYMACIVLGDDEDQSVARLGLAHAAKIVLASALGLLGVSAPESMERSE